MRGSPLIESCQGRAYPYDCVALGCTDFLIEFPVTGTSIFFAAHFLGHAFGLIPAPGCFTASAFTVPRQQLPGSLP